MAAGCNKKRPPETGGLSARSITCRPGPFGPGSPAGPKGPALHLAVTSGCYCLTANTHTPEPACGQCESTSSSLATVEIQLCASVPVTNATYCRPLTMKLIGLPDSFVSMRGDFHSNFPLSASNAIMYRSVSPTNTRPPAVVIAGLASCAAWR